jgi:hypothetical protein
LGDDFPELEPSSDVIIVRAEDSLWQKERLLNIAIDHTPEKYSKIAWLDCDVLFSEYEWAEKTSGLLNQFPLIQPFNRVALLPPEGPESLVFRTYWGSFAAPRTTPLSDKHGHTGFAWAARRDLLVRHHLYDAAIIGHGDHLIGHAVRGDWDSPCLDYHIPTPEFRDHFQEWAEPFFQDVHGSTTSLVGELQHLWHGELRDRRYRSRHRPLQEFKFDPRQDIRISPSGAWEWASEKTELHQFVSRYFQERNEDG